MGIIISSFELIVSFNVLCNVGGQLVIPVILQKLAKLHTLMLPVLISPHPALFRKRRRKEVKY